MTALPLHLRCEQKFVVHGVPLANVLARVHRHPALFRVTYPERVVNNLYLDSPSLHDYHDHVNGIARRAKTRIRWYGPRDGRIEAPTLERKIRLGNVGSKIAHRLGPFCLAAGVGVVLDNPGLPEALRAVLPQLRPALVNCYARRYFVSADGGVRLTVDTDLQFQAWGGHACGVRATSPGDGAIILELKFAPGQEWRAARVTNAFPFRLTRCSKYILGLQSLGAV